MKNILLVTTKLYRYILYNRHPWIQVFYGIIMIGTYLIFLEHLFPFIPNRHISSNYRYCVDFFFWGCIVIHFWLSISDPGVITPQNIIEYDKYQPHDFLFPSKKECSTCHTEKIPRSKHCRLCNHCVARFDHHCIWVNNCIGYNNYGLFILFLLTKICFIAVSFYALSGTILSIVEDKNQNIKFLSREHLSYLFLEFLTTYSHRYITVISSMGIVSWFTLSIFLGYHMRRMASNTTTNEQEKRRQLLEKLYDNDRVQLQGKPFEMDRSWGGLVDTNDEPHHKNMPVLSIDSIEYNPYDFNNKLENVFDALFPNFYPTKMKTL